MVTDWFMLGDTVTLMFGAGCCGMYGCGQGWPYKPGCCIGGP
jgi:hypothetical protein